MVLRVTDKSKAKAKFLLFNNAAHKLIRRSAFELVEEAAEVFPSFIIFYGLSYISNNYIDYEYFH